jgi:flagellar L-ring protein FlgH
MIVEGSSEVVVNSEKNTIAISGIVRPQDINANNTVLSTQLADAKVRMLGKGPLADKTKRGVFETILDWVWPF